MRMGEQTDSQHGGCTVMRLFYSVTQTSHISSISMVLWRTHSTLRSQCDVPLLHYLWNSRALCARSLLCSLPLTVSRWHVNQVMLWRVLHHILVSLRAKVIRRLYCWHVEHKAKHDFINKGLEVSWHSELKFFITRDNQLTGDPIATALYTSLTHLEQKKSYARLIFIDFIDW